MASKNQGRKKCNQTKDLKCATHLLSEKFEHMSEKKKAIVRDLGFGGLMHIPPMRVHHKLLKELANSFKLGKNTLETSYGSFRVKPNTIGVALGLNASGDLFPEKVSYKELSEENKQIFRRFQGRTLKNLTDGMMSIGVGNEQDCLMFKRIFILYIQMAFLLPTTINKISHVHLAPIFKMDKIKEGNWGAPYKKGEERLAQPWIANWNREQLVEKMRAEMDGHMVFSFTNNCFWFPKKNGADLRSTKGHYDSSETIPDVNLGSESDHLSQGHTDQSSINKPAESMLSLIEESTNDPAEQNMMVVRVETQSQTEALSIVPIQVYLPLSQTTPVLEIEPTPAKSPSEKNNEEITKISVTILFYNDSFYLTLQHSEPPKPNESTPTVPSAPSKINPTPEDAATLMMMARTISYIPKEGPMPSFSLGLIDSSQEEAISQEGERANTFEMPKIIEQLGELVERIASNGVKIEGKSPQIQKQSGEESFEKYETPTRTNDISAEMKEKCYIWTTRVKTYGDGSTNEYDAMCTLNA
ncbi:uncharacterized protein DS421_2g56220 [Arachis hypogaea]|nr:uncharacterized protein DS421_2g56220 [Arachis hypogaea]